LGVKPPAGNWRDIYGSQDNIRGAIQHGKALETLFSSDTPVL
jgi:hypothetical protein